MGAFSLALCVVNSYGEQKITKKEEVEEKWGRLRKELEDIRRRGEHIVSFKNIHGISSSPY